MASGHGTVAGIGAGVIGAGAFPGGFGVYEVIGSGHGPFHNFWFDIGFGFWVVGLAIVLGAAGHFVYEWRMAKRKPKGGRYTPPKERSSAPVERTTTQGDNSPAIGQVNQGRGVVVQGGQGHTIHVGDAAPVKPDPVLQFGDVTKPGWMSSLTKGGAYDSMSDGRQVAAAWEYHVRVDNGGPVDADLVRVCIVSTDPSDPDDDLPIDLEWRGPNAQTEKRIPAGRHAYAVLNKFILDE